MGPIESYHGHSWRTTCVRGIGRARGFLGGVELVLLYFAVTCILALGCIVLSSVTLRELGFSGVPDEVVIVGELMIGGLILPLAYVAADKGFIAVEVFTNRFGPRVQIGLNLLSAVVGLIAVSPIFYSSYLSMVEAIEYGSYFFGLLELPTWPGQVMFFIGYTVFFIRLIDLTVYETLILCGVISPRATDPTEE